MLLELCIKNFVIIEDATINFSEGLNVITGETGAGKSLVIDAINIIAGGKFSKEDIRKDTKKSSIHGLLNYSHDSLIIKKLEGYGVTLEEDNTLLISREISSSGRSVCRLNGQIVTLTMLKSITVDLMDIVGQNEHQLLLNVSKHLDFVDSFIGKKSVLLKEDILLIIDKIRKSQKNLMDICGDEAERERRLDLFSYQINEIENASLKSKEDEELRNRRTILSNAEKLYKGISSVYENIFKGEGANLAVIDIIGDSLNLIKDAELIDGNLHTFKAALENSLYQLDDIKNEMRLYRDDIEFNDSEIDNIEERLDFISKLRRKYGNSIEEILEYKDKVSKQYEDLINSEKVAKEIENKIKEFTSNYYDKATSLSNERDFSCKQLEKLVEQELQDLNMEGARFKISLSNDSTLISKNGIDRIEFLISPNPGEIEKPLNKIASGGEMSRVLLAIKNALASSLKLECVVFDEVDSGIGGITATMVGQKIRAISKSVQTICITHLPQIAAFGDNHIVIDKKIDSNNTFVKVYELNKDKRITEIARMLGGDEDSQASLNHAKELIKSSR